jgi:hypothetical protein
MTEHQPAGSAVVGDVAAEGGDTQHDLADGWLWWKVIAPPVEQFP